MKKEMNNKGFSLVELIIVIAIMVILVAVLAPQYLRYVEKSRVSTDVQTAVEFINACQVLASDPEADLTGTSYTITSGTNSGTITVDTTLATKLTDLGMMDSTSIKAAKFQSTAYKNENIIIELKYDLPATGATEKIWFVKCTGIDVSGAIPTSGSGGGGGGGTT